MTGGASGDDDEVIGDAAFAGEVDDGDVLALTLVERLLDERQKALLRALRGLTRGYVALP
jgi:hypothetical protein